MQSWILPGGPLGDAGDLDTLLSHTGGAGAGIGSGAVLVEGERRWTSAELEHLVDATAARFAARGVHRGDVVAWKLANCAEAVLLFRACWRLGAVAAPLHHRAGPAEVADLKDRLAPRLFVDDTRVRDLFAGDVPSAYGAALAAPGHGTAPSDIAVVLHTSGTTGSPKGVLHTHRSLAYKATTMVGVHDLGPADVVLMPAPLAHVSGLLNGILVPGTVPFRCVLMARWSPDEALDLIEREGVTFMVGPPTFFLGLESSSGFTTERVASLRLLSVGGAGVTPEFVRHASDLFGAVVKRTYGSTEAPTVATAASGDTAEDRERFDGRALEHVRLQVVRPGGTEPLPDGCEGELRVCGPELFAGYLDPAGNEGAVEGDWLRTGDLAVLDDLGRLRITGRLKELIIRGGENISATEVEAHLVAHPAVRLAVALGEPDAHLGERVCAVVELCETGDRFDLDACREWFAERGVARFRTPERVVVVDEVPLLASGKANRAAVAARLSELA